jgi:glycosyltransferase involved in cell wall biosynthesis
VRILQVNRYFSPSGGAETVMFETMRLLQANGHEIVPFSMHHEENHESSYSSFFVSNVVFEPDGSSDLSTLAPARWPLVGRGLYSRGAQRNIEILLKVTRPEIAHMHSIYHQLSPSVLLPLKRHGIPTVLTLHDYKLVCPSSTLFANGAICERCKGGRFYNAVLQGCVHDSHWKGVFCAAESYLHGSSGIYRKNIDVYIAPSLFLKNKMMEFGLDGDRIFHVPNPLNLQGYEASKEAGKSILFCGRLERVKGLMTLLKAVAGSTIASKTEVVIAGEGRQRAALEQFCARNGLGNVRFLGWRPRQELAELHRRAMFTVIPPHWYENSPLAVLEAKAYGRAVIGSNIGGIPELIEDGATGLLFEPGNARDLRAKIEYMLENPQEAYDMGARAREAAEISCAPERQYTQLMNVYDRAIEFRRGAPLQQAVAAGR